MAVRYAALSAFGAEKTWPMATITGRTDRQTDRRTDRVRRIMRPPPREEGRIITTLVDGCCGLDSRWRPRYCSWVCWWWLLLHWRHHSPPWMTPLNKTMTLAAAEAMSGCSVNWWPLFLNWWRLFLNWQAQTPSYNRLFRSYREMLPNWKLEVDRQTPQVSCGI